MNQKKALEFVLVRCPDCEKQYSISKWIATRQYYDIYDPNSWYYVCPNPECQGSEMREFGSIFGNEEGHQLAQILETFFDKYYNNVNIKIKRENSLTNYIKGDK